MDIKKRNKIIKRAFIATTVSALVLLFILVMTNVSSLSAKKKELDAKVSDIEKSIELQEKKTAELEAYKEYTKTREFTEQVAREKLGLIYPGEIVLRPEE